MTTTYELIRIAMADDAIRVLGRGTRQQVKQNLDRLRKDCLPGFRYIMRREGQSK